MAKSYRCLLPVDNICPALIGAQGNNCPGGPGGGELCSAPASGSFFPRPLDTDAPMGVFLRETRGDAPRLSARSGVRGAKRREGGVRPAAGRGGGGQGHPGGRVGMDVRGPLRSQFLMVLPGLLVAGA